MAAASGGLMATAGCFNDASDADAGHVVTAGDAYGIAPADGGLRDAAPDVVTGGQAYGVAVIEAGPKDDAPDDVIITGADAYGVAPLDGAEPADAPPDAPVED